MPNGLSILLIEDDLDARINLCDILELDSHQISVAGSAEEARKLISELEFSVVILDRKLPDSTAETLLPELRLCLPLADVVMVTGYADLTSTITALQHGVTDYILKPVNPDALRASLGKIARQRRVEFELRKEQQFASLVLDTADAIILVLDLEANIVRQNAYLERLTGWPPEETKGKNWFDLFIPDEERERLRELFLETAQGNRTRGVVNSVLTRDQELLQVRWSNSALKDDTGNVTGLLSIGIDISDMVKAQRKTLQSERLAAIGQTMTGLAHETRNALQRIDASLDILEMELDDRPEAAGDLNSIRRASRAMNTLLDEVRAYAAPIALHRQAIDLRELWRQVWQQLKPDWSVRSVEFTEAVHNADLRVKVDLLRMEQVFRNLFENALAACEDPCKISIACTCANSETVEIVVADSGPGLNPEQREKIFDAFYTTKQTGTGLGMSIVLRIVEAHGGEIRVGTTLQNGASFIIRLPRHRTTETNV